jgi:formylmethanofuran dehydrogenase subunit C
LKEQYAADAGVEDALWHLAYGGLQVPEDESAPLPEFTINGGKTVSVTVKNEGDDIYKITSTATSDDGSSTTIVSYIGSTTITRSVFDYAAAALGEEDCDLYLSGSLETGSTEVHGGDVYANGSICLQGGAVYVDGDATATGDITCNGGECSEDKIAGEQTEGAPPIEAPDIDIAARLADAEAGGVHEGDKTINHNDTLGPLHITGNLRIEGNATVTLQGTVYVSGTIWMAGGTEIQGGHDIVADGDITLTGSSQLDLEDIPFVISTAGSITLTGNDWTSAIVYAPERNIALTGSSMLYGAAVGESVTGTGNAEIDYPPGLMAGRGLPGGVVGLEIRTYNINP